MDLSKVKEFLHSLSREEYATFMKDVHESYPNKSTELTNEIVNRWKKADKKTGAGRGEERKLTSSPAPVEATGSSDLGSKPTSSLPKPWQKSAWKTGFIFRGDKVPIGGKLFLDVEKVSLVKQSGQTKHKLKAATIALVNEDGKLVFWAFIKIKKDLICQYSPKITNLDQLKLEMGVTEETVHECLKICLEGNTLVGFALAGDLASLGIQHDSCIDLQDFIRDASGTFALALVVKKWLQSRSGFQEGHHSAIDDARMTLAVYKKYLELKQNASEFGLALKKLSNSREEYKKQKPMYFSEKCSCFKRN